MNLGELARRFVQLLGVGLEADSPAFQTDDRFFHVGQNPRQLLHLGSPDESALAQIELRIGHAPFHELGPHLLVGLHVIGLGPSLDHAKQRRLGHIDMAGGDELIHLPVEEAQQQRADVAAVHIGVGHDDDLVVAELGDVLIDADAGADGLDHGLDFGVVEDFVFARFVSVDDLAAEWKDGLELAEAASFGAAAG